MKLRGSALVFSLVVLSFLLISALSVATVSVTNKRSVLTSKNSTLSFQIADSAAEKILQQIYKVSDISSTPFTDLGALAGALGSGVDCKITPNPDVIQGTDYTVVFFENTGTATEPIFDAITCDDPNWRINIVKMKILGTFGGVTRAIEVGIAPDATP